MPIRHRLLPWEEHRHPRARPLAGAAVQVRVELAAHYIQQAHTLGKLLVPCRGVW